jgi:hypothetical protein
VWIGVKSQLTVVTVDNDIVGVLWTILHVFTNAEYAVIFVFTASAVVVPLLLLKNTVDGFLCAEFRIVGCSPGAWMRCSSQCPCFTWTSTSTACGGTGNILEMVQRSPITNTRRLSTRLCFSRTRVWRTLHDDGLNPFQPQRVQNLHSGDSAMRLEFCHWLHTNRQSLPLILFTDEAIFTRNGINNTHNSHRRSHDSPHGTVETNFNVVSLSVCGAVWSVTCWLVPLFRLWYDGPYLPPDLTTDYAECRNVKSKIYMICTTNFDRRKYDCAGKVQQQFWTTDPSSRQIGRHT